MKYARWVLLLVPALYCLPLSLAQKPDWISVNDVLSEALNEASPEPSKLAYSFQRCAALDLVLSSLMEEGSPEGAANYLLASSILSQASVLIRANLERQRTGNSPDIEVMSESSLNAIIELQELYWGWANNNYLMNGSYFERDEELQEEMLICRSAAELAQAMMKSVSDAEQ